ncbi:MAG TPA: hypothetical protein VH092_14700 [Urbifossiella sp.]|jgi:hypothetical protein|nr:hypothetical protein [Urbifossiella sp.]
MRRFLSLAVVCAAGLVVVGCKSKEQVEAEKSAIKAEQDKLQGKWKVASRTGEQQEDEDAPPPSSYYVIEGDTLKLVYLDKDGKEEVDSAHEASGVSPRSFRRVAGVAVFRL